MGEEEEGDGMGDRGDGTRGGPGEGRRRGKEGTYFRPRQPRGP
jgi:hypothetical protein